MSKNGKKRGNSAAQNRRTAEKTAKKPERLKIVLISAAAVLLLALAVVLAVKLVFRDEPDGGKDGLSIENLTQYFAQLKREGEIATYYTFNDYDLILKENELKGKDIDVDIKKGSFAKMLDDEIYAYEFASEQEARAVYDYYESFLSENYRAVLAGKIFVYGTDTMLDLVLPNFVY